jgi:hypothetical protein
MSLKDKLEKLNEHLIDSKELYVSLLNLSNEMMKQFDEKDFESLQETYQKLKKVLLLKSTYPPMMLEYLGIDSLINGKNNK